MKNINLLLIVLSGAFLTSCISINGLTNDYNKLSNDNKLRIKKIDTFNNLDKNFIYEINAIQLLEELKTQDKSLVYMYLNNCSSESCIPISNYIQYANKNNYKLYVVLNGYAFLDSNISSLIKEQHYAIDVTHYKTKNRKKYINKFKTELLKLKDEKFEGNIFLFQNDSLISVLSKLKF